MKINDWTLSRIQALTLDALAPLTSILELFNSDAEEIQSEVVAKAVESAVVLLGNASSHISNLWRTKVLEEYNKDLVTWAQDHEGEFLKAAPQLFGPEFPKHATTHLEQVAALRKARYTPSMSVFRKGQSSRSSGGTYFQQCRPAPYYPPVKRQQGASKKPPQQEREVTINCEPEPSNHSCTYAISTFIKCKSYVGEGKGNRVQVSTKGKAPLKVTGRLASFVNTWKVLTRDTWVLDAIQGYKIPLLGTPYQSYKPEGGILSA